MKGSFPIGLGSAFRNSMLNNPLTFPIAGAAAAPTSSQILQNAVNQEALSFANDDIFQQ